MALKDRKWVVPAGYVLLGVASFAYFLFLGFPFDRLLTAKPIADRLAQAERANGVTLEVGTIRGGWLFDLVAKDVKIIPVNPLRRAGAETAPVDPLVRIDSISLRPSLLSLFSLRLGAHVNAALYGGHVSGTVAVGRSSTVVDLAVKGVELAKYATLPDRFQLNVMGEASGDVDLLLDTADGTKSTGRIDLSLRNAAINESNPFGIAKIPHTGFDRGAGAVIALKDGRAEFKDVGLHGDDLDVTVDGQIELKRQLPFSTWDLRASIKPSASFKQAVPLVDTFLGPGRSGDGYRYKITGTLPAPHAFPFPGR